MVYPYWSGKGQTSMRSKVPTVQYITAFRVFSYQTRYNVILPTEVGTILDILTFRSQKIQTLLKNRLQDILDFFGSFMYVYPYWSRLRWEECNRLDQCPNFFTNSKMHLNQYIPSETWRRKVKKHILNSLVKKYTTSLWVETNYQCFSLAELPE